MTDVSLLVRSRTLRDPSAPLLLARALLTVPCSPQIQASTPRIAPADMSLSMDKGWAV